MKILYKLSMFNAACLWMLAISSSRSMAAESIFPSSVPGATDVAYNDATPYELGTVFSPLVSGVITHVRVYSLAQESGNHTVRIWRNSDNTLLAGPITWNYGGDAAWITLDIPDVAVDAGTEYTIAISCINWYPAAQHYLSASGTNGQNLRWPANAGAFTASVGTQPTTRTGNGYLRDVVFAPNTPPAILKVSGSGTDIEDGDPTPSYIDNTQFGGAYLGGLGTNRTFVITNTSGSSVALTGSPKVVITGAQAGDFTVTVQPASSVPASGTTTFTVHFQPSATGTRDAQVIITNAATPANPLDFAIEGIGMGGDNLIIGSVSEGNIAVTPGDHWITGSRQLALRNMRVTEIKAKLVASTAHFKCAIYSDNDGQAEHLLQSSSEVTNPTDGWQTLTLTAPLDLTAGTYYWLAIWTDSNTSQVYADTGGLSSRGDYPYGSWPDPISFTAIVGGTYSLYAEGVPLDVSGPEMEVEANEKPVLDNAVSTSVENGTDLGGTTVSSGTRQTTFTILNVGQSSLNLTGTPKVSISGAQAGDFTVTAQPPATIAAGATATFTVQFAPSGFGSRIATITIPHADSPANPYDFAIQGFGLGGGAAVLGNDGQGTITALINNDQIHGNRFQSLENMRFTEIHAKVLDFVGTSGTIQCAIYSDNNGWANQLLGASIDVLNPTNGWNTFPLTAPVDVSAGDYYWLVVWSDTAGAAVYADPTGTTYYGNYIYADLGGTWPDPINLTSGTINGRTYCIYAEGSPLGLAPGPELDVRGNGKLIVSGDTTPSALDGTDFGDLNVQSGNRDQIFTITNAGNATLQLNGNPFITATGSQAADFTIVSQPSSSIAVGGTASFIVRFDPLNRGVRKATITITNNDGNENPYQFAVQGVGTITNREEFLWPDTKTGTDVYFDGENLELGTIFQASVPGKITHLRVYSLANESGPHTARIWRNGDDTVIGGPYTWDYGNYTGWITLDIPDVNIDAGTDYTISISTGTSPQRNYPVIDGDLVNPGGNNQHLSYPASGGVYATALGTRPAQSFGGANYLRDIVFVPTGTPVNLPNIGVLGSGTAITNGDTSSATVDGTDFGATAIGSITDHTFTITNNGLSALNFTATPRVIVNGVSAGVFTTVSQPSASVPINGTSTFTVRFSPTALGNASGIVFIENDSDENPFFFTITGTAAVLPLRITAVTANPALGSFTLHWEGGSPQFQVEKAPMVSGPYEPVGSPLSTNVFTDSSAFGTNSQSFYRVRQL